MLHSMDEPSTFARSAPHPDALFSVVLLNKHAAAVLVHPNNRHLVSNISNANEPNRFGLNIGLHITCRSQSRLTLATLGRHGADITLLGANISRIQCAFEAHETTGVIMLLDCSRAASTQVRGNKAVPFECGRSPRRVMVTYNNNTEFGIGGINCDLFTFSIFWHNDPR